MTKKSETKKTKMENLSRTKKIPTADFYLGNNGGWWGANQGK